MNRKIYFFLFFLVLGSFAVNGQEMPTSTRSSQVFDNFFAIAWDISIPMGDKPFVNETSLAGGKMEYRKMLQNNISVGFDVTWNSYKEYKPYQTYNINGNTDITTDLYKFNYTLPMAITAHKYWPNASGTFITFAGLGLGATYGRPSIFFNIYELYNENWGFLARPEVGAMIKADRSGDMAFLVAVRYSYSTNKETSFKIDNLQSLGFNVGLCWAY